MANRAIDDFNDVYYNEQYSAPQPEDREISNNEALHAKIAPFSSSIPVQNYVYQPRNPLLGYDPATDPSMSMGLGPGDSFPYDLSTHPSSSLPLGRALDNIASLQPQASRPENISAYSTTQSGDYTPSMCWDQPHIRGGITPSNSSALSQPLAATCKVEPSTCQASQVLQHQHVQSLPQASVSGPVHRFIQPKTLPGKSHTSAIPESETTRKSTPYSNIYSQSGFDMMGILGRVVSRHDPKIDLGPVDLSCAFVLCDLTLEDHPIVYVSNAFERLTGYTEREIVGKNCRFLQSPNAQVERGEPRKFVDSYTALRLRYAIEQMSEIQVSIINYRKGGQPFMNLVTMIPVHWDSKDYFVGFQVDLVERPDAVTKRNSGGTYMIDYHRTQLPNYAVPSPDIYQDYHDPATQFSPSQVSVILDSVVAGQPVARSHLHHMLVENTGDVIFVLSYEGEFLYLSPSCRTMLEYKTSDLLGKTLSAICHPSDIGPVTRDLRACTSDGPISVIYRIRRKYSGFTWFENHGGWHITEKGRQYMVLVGRIIPVYSSIQLAYLERGGLMENDLWAKLSLSGIILFMSSKSRTVLGRSSDDLMGKCIQDILVSDNLQPECGIQQALESSRNDQQTAFTHQIRHRKGHALATQITLYPGDMPEDDSKPNFLIAHLRFPKPVQPQEQPSLSTTDDQARDQSRSQNSGDAKSGDTRQLQTAESALHLKPHPNFPHPFTTSSATLAVSSSLVSESSSGSASAEATHLFEELNPTRGSSWYFELRELEKQNRGLAEEAQRLLARGKKRRRKQSAAVIEKSCVMCHTKTTPEWRRGPSGNRDLCNSCGLRWAKQVRNVAQMEKPVAVA